MNVIKLQQDSRIDLRSYEQYPNLDNILNLSIEQSLRALNEECFKLIRSGQSIHYQKIISFPSRMKRFPYIELSLEQHNYDNYVIESQTKETARHFRELSDITDSVIIKIIATIKDI